MQILLSTFPSPDTYDTGYLKEATLLPSCPAVRPDQFDFSFHGPDRPKILGIQKKKKKGVAMHGQIASVRGYSLCLPQCSLQPLSAQNYCEAKYSWKETFGEVICKLNPKSVDSKVNINFFFAYLRYRLIFWQN